MVFSGVNGLFSEVDWVDVFFSGVDGVFSGVDGVSSGVDSAIWISVFWILGRKRAHGGPGGV